MLGIVIPAHNEALLIGASVGAVMAAARQPDLRGEAVEVVVVLDASRDWPVERLVRERPKESREALHRLGVDVEPVRLGLPDGGLRGLENWHWAARSDRRLPWVRARRLDLDAPACRCKQSALRATTLERAARPFEAFFA